MTLAALLVFALAVSRVTRFVTADVLFNGPRERVVAWAWARRHGGQLVSARSEDGDPLGQLPMWQAAKANGGVEPKLATLATCPWCASIYVAAVAAPLWFWLGSSPWVLVPAAALAFSYVTGLLAQHGG